MALAELGAELQSESGSSAGSKSQNPVKDIHNDLGERMKGMVEEPIGGIANILGDVGKGLGAGVGSVVLLPFAIASLPFIGIHKGIQWASKGKKEETK